MAITIGKGLRDEVRSITFEWEGESAEVRFYPGKVTREQLRQLDAKEALDTDIAFLVEVLESWEVEDEEGNVLPITEETLSNLPLVFNAHLAETVLVALKPDPKPKATSGATSRRKGSFV